MNFVTKIALSLFAIGSVILFGWHYATHWGPSKAHYPLQGIDLGPAPGPVEWGTVRARGADFAYIVATAGADRRDPAFEANWAALPDAGIRRGAIHLYSLCQSAEDQANAFNTFVPRDGDALPAALDIEFHDDCTARPDRAALIGDIRRFVTMVETHLRKPVLLRISRAVDRQYQLSAAIPRPIWATGNFLSPSYPARPWRMWRASDIRRIDGIDGPVNWDVVAP